MNPPTSTDLNIPREGMLATVRNRRGLVTAVEPHDGGPSGVIHLVTVEYTDADGVAEDQLIWELEVNASVKSPSALPLVTDEACRVQKHDRS
jgi:hypothetical protein